MIIKLVLSTGKEIELTEEEYNELVKEKEYVYVPTSPTYPVNPWYPTYPIITYTNADTYDRNKVC